jgi:hypothetical protein
MNWDFLARQPYVCINGYVAELAFAFMGAVVGARRETKCANGTRSESGRPPLWRAAAFGSHCCPWRRAAGLPVAEATGVLTTLDRAIDQ